MDPNETLRQIRLLIRQSRVDRDPQTFIQHARDLADAVEDLDAWMSRGGFAPKEWGRR
jgi:hypothetical protein